MRVAVVHNLIEGGARRRLLEQTRALRSDVVEITTSDAAPVTSRPYIITSRLRADRLPGHLRPVVRYRDLGHLTRTWDELTALAQTIGADIIYANPDSTIKGAMPLRRCPLPVLRYCDEPRRIDYETGLAATQRRRTRAVYANLRRRQQDLDREGVHAADVLATNSRYSADGICRAYGRLPIVLPCGVPDSMVPGPSSMRSHVLSVGSMIPSKGHELVIRAVAHSGISLPVVIVCPRRDDAEAQRLTDIAAACSVRLDLRVGVGDDELVMLYRDAYATMYLAAKEPLGLVSLEAQACGTPVIVANEGGLPETVVDGAGGIVVARDPAAAGAALRSLHEPGVGRRMARAARQNAARQTWEQAGRLLEDALTELVAAKTGTVAEARRA